MAKKTKTKTKSKSKSKIMSAAQLQKSSGQLFKDAFKSIQQNCQQALAAIKPQLKKNLASVKQAKQDLKGLEQKITVANSALAKKKTAALQSKAKKLAAKMKEAVRTVTQFQANSDQLQQELVAINAFKAEMKARELAAKDFDKNYQPKAPVKAEKIEKAAKPKKVVKAKKSDKPVKSMVESLLDISDKKDTPDVLNKEPMQEEMLVD